MRRGLVVVGLAVLAAACSSSDNDRILPSAEVLRAFTRTTNVLLVQADVDGTPSLLGVDTGAPIMLLSSSIFHYGHAVDTARTIEVGGKTFDGVDIVVSKSSPASPDPDVPLDGLIGCPILCGTVATFDYRGNALTLDDTPSIDGLLPETMAPFDFEGGGQSIAVTSTESITLPRSRVVVTVDIEGNPYRMLVDSGASEVFVDADTYATLTTDGRRQITAGNVQTTSGTSSASYFRVAKVAVGGAEADGVVFAHDTSFDKNIAAISSDAGETVHGSLGGTFLEHFAVTVDYPNRTLHFAPYEDSSFIVDPAEIVGVSLASRTDAGYPIGSVFPGSDAERKGVRAGEVLTAIDGLPLALLTATQVNVLLGGKVYTAHTLQFNDRTLTVDVDELLPLSP